MDSIYDRAITEVGQNGLFQKKFDLTYNVILGSLWAMAYMNIFLALTIIPHNCEIPEKPDNVSAYSWKLKHIPLSDKTGNAMFSSCLLYLNPGASNDTVACDKYSYDHTWYDTTVPSENDWVCDKELKVSNLLLYAKIAEIIGSLFFGWFGDMYGRRPTFIITLILIVAGRSISIFSSNYYIFLCGCIIAALPSWSMIQSTTVISIEISSPSRRTITSTLRFAGWTTGMCIMPLIYWWLRSWKSFLIVTTATQIPFMLLSWKIIESPRWLWVEGRSKECVKELKRIAKVNKTKLKVATEEELLTSKASVTNSVLGPIALFSSPTLAANTIMQLILWVSVTMSYTVLLLRAGEKQDGNPFLEFAWQSFAELPGNILAGWLADNIGRTNTGAMSFGVAAAMWALIACREIYTNTWLNYWWLGSAMVILSRLFSTVSYYTINLLNMELYPTCLRQSGMSLGNVLSSGAAGVSSYILYVGHQVDARLPGVILAAVSIVGVISSLLLPETLNAKLPETLLDAQTFGQTDKKYRVLFLKRSTLEKEME